MRCEEAGKQNFCWCIREDEVVNWGGGGLVLHCPVSNTFSSPGEMQLIPQSPSQTHFLLLVQSLSSVHAFRQLCPLSAAEFFRDGQLGSSTSLAGKDKISVVKSGGQRRSRVQVTGCYR